MYRPESMLLYRDRVGASGHESKGMGPCLWYLPRITYS
jgi:hypothetical protein